MASGDMFLKLEGTKTGLVKGEAQDEKHGSEIDILGWSWGMSTSGSIGGAGVGARSALSAISFRKLVDSATTPLMSVMRNHELIKEAKLTVRKAGGEQIEFLFIIIRGGRIVAYEIAAPSGPVVTEEFSVAFEQIEVQYHTQAQAGNRLGGMTFSADARTA
jgi:type VI secretion system secreted protein Hcp